MLELFSSRQVYRTEMSSVQSKINCILTLLLYKINIVLHFESQNCEIKKNWVSFSVGRMKTNMNVIRWSFHISLFTSFPVHFHL